MANFKVKKKYLGATIFLKGLGQTTVEAHHGDLLAKHGKSFMLEGIKPAKKLKPLKEKTKKELTEQAKDLEGYSSDMTKDELIELINDTTPKSNG